MWVLVKKEGTVPEVEMVVDVRQRRFANENVRDYENARVCPRVKMLGTVLGCYGVFCFGVSLFLCLIMLERDCVLRSFPPGVAHLNAEAQHPEA